MQVCGRFWPNARIRHYARKRPQVGVANRKVRLAKHLADSKKTPGYPSTEDFCISLTDGFWKNYIAPWDRRSAFRQS
jgi:hypothetical protein